MKEFFKMMFASMTGCLITVLVVFFVMMGVISGLMSSGDSEIVVEDKTVLVIELNKAIVERTTDNPFENIDFASMKSDKSLGLNQILATIKYAATDERIGGILLDLSGLDAGYATIEAIRNQLDTFKASGKFVFAYGDSYSQKAFYLASIAQKLYLNPKGSIEFKGLYMESMFFKGALEKLEVDAQIIRHGKFKSAVEPFMLDKMSDANRLQLQTFANSLWGQVVDQISKSRAVNTASLNSIADSLLAWDASGALKYKLVDGLVYRDELESLLNTKSETEGGAPTLSLSDYYSSVKEKMFKYSENRIAVIYAFGEINNGKASYGTISGKAMSKTIRDAANDPAIKAIVLRVNSPGGDALASEMIWREVYLANKIKPVVVSMGDYAASGGYYISCAARRIYAEPTTLTGSIGVFGVIPNLQKMFNNKLGITFDGVKTNDHSDYIGVNKPMSDFDRAVIQKQIEDIYATFVQRVADGRKMTNADVDSIGQGRIWCGVDALRIGLVDELGGIDYAIAYAAKEAGISEYSIEELPIEKDFFTEFVENMQSDTRTADIMRSELGDFAPLFDAWQRATQMSGVQTRLPFFLIMH
jgi:protease-4